MFITKCARRNSTLFAKLRRAASRRKSSPRAAKGKILFSFLLNHHHRNKNIHSNFECLSTKANIYDARRKIRATSQRCGFICVFDSSEKSKLFRNVSLIENIERPFVLLTIDQFTLRIKYRHCMLTRPSVIDKKRNKLFTFQQSNKQFRFSNNIVGSR